MLRSQNRDFESSRIANRLAFLEQHDEVRTAIASEQRTTEAATPMPRPESVLSDMRSPRPEPAAVYELEVLVCRLAEGDTRGRAANLPLPESRADTVREVLQNVIEAARGMINECLARDHQIPWIDPPALPEENESRFVVPLTL